MHQSIATIDSPEFINLQPLDINPLMSRCEIKVLYLGENRNHSYITKEVASDMAKTLRGAPIVGYYKEEKEDFADHGERVIFDDEGVKFECLTKPYGFVDPQSEVWFQKFEDTDDFGNTTTREYLMATGFLWTEQFEECKSVLENGKNQSMELDEKSLDGNWSTNSKTGMDFFIINDAIFSKLCILGDDVEPCFEGARVTAPDVSTSFSKVDDTFKKTLYTMMQELKFALEGGQSNMDLDNKEEVIDTVENVDVTETQETSVEENDKVEQTISTENQESIEAQSNDSTFAKKEDEESDDAEDAADDKEDKTDDDEKDKTKNTCKEEKTKHSLEEDYEELKTQFSALQEEYAALVEFKNQIENEKKDELINSFYMLADEDKADVIENKAKYSLDEIEAKLSVICVRKKVNFDLDEDASEDKKDNDVDDISNVMTYTLGNEENSTPAWISALRKTQNDRKEK